MARTSRQSQYSARRFLMPSVMALALMRLRKTWFLLFITSLGMIAAVIITCAIPLFSDVMTTAGLRDTLNATPVSAEIPISAITLGLSTSLVNDAHKELEDPVHQQLGSLVQQTRFSISSYNISFVRPPHPKSTLTTYSITTHDISTHLGQLQGHGVQITHTPTSDIEVLLSSATARQLNATVGSTFNVTMNYALQLSNFNTGPQPAQYTLLLVAHVVGIFNVSAANSSYFRDATLDPGKLATEQETIYSYTMVTSNNALLALYDGLRENLHVHAIFSPSNSDGYGLFWSYRLNTSQIFIQNLDSLVERVNGLELTYLNQGSYSGGSSQYPYLFHASIDGPLFGTIETPGILESFRSRVSVARVPIIVLTLQIVALILFFISLLTNLLVDSQAETLALLRSRGASGLQVFGALLLQSVLLGIVAIVIGVPLAIVTVIILAWRVLPVSEQNALNVVTQDVVQAGQSVLLYAVAIAAVAIVTMSITLFFAARTDILSVRRESSRTSRRPFWQRFNLDVIAGLIALLGYALSLYLTSVGNVLQGDAKTLVTAPLSILAPFFLILACILLFLRLFPLFLQLGAFLAARRRGAVSLLAIMQIARSPRQSVRMTMLLALAVAFALFTLVFTATQAQHIQDVTTYLTGADFSGSIATLDNSSNGKSTPITPIQVIKQYQAIPGVLAVSTGYSTTGQAGSTNLSVEIRAVDTATFANAVNWASQEDYKTAKQLSPQLSVQADTTHPISVIVDTNVTTLLQLHVGSPLLVKEDSQSVHDLHCIIIGAVQHIPTVNDKTSTTVGLGNQVLVSGGVLMEYQRYATVYAQQSKPDPNAVATPPTINSVWLHTRDDAVSLASVRTTLTSTNLYLERLSDRRALLSSLNNDPLYVVISGVLGLGTITALLLALVGDLLASWLSARTRLTNFAVLRALGTTPQQVVGVLTWEQGVVYVTGLLLGIIFGITFALTVIPSLTFTDLNTTVSSSAFYYLQSSISTQVVLPPSLPIALLVLVLIFVLALALMVRVVASPALSQTLRLNAD